MKYYVTFGQRYKTEPHPKVAYAHPDGYLLINAENMSEAREKAFEELGQAWAFIYEHEDFLEESQNFYPLGVLKEI